MRLLLLFLLIFGILFAPCGCASGSSKDGAGESGPGGQILEVGQSMGTDGKIDQNQTLEQNRTGERVANQTGETVQVQNMGISQQVQEVVRQRVNGSISVPQGMVVRIIARNRTMSVENATFILNQTLRANVMVQGRNRSLLLEPGKGIVNITDENVTVTTAQTIEMTNDSLFVGAKKVMLMPSSVPSKIKAKTIHSMVLHETNGELLYQVNATKKVRFLWFFDAEMDVEVDLDAETGEIKNQKGPWWSFLASETG